MTTPSSGNGSAPNGTVVLAYSGGLDTSALVPWLKEKYGYDVVCCLVDIGRVKDVPGIMKRAEAAGAIAAVAIDAKEEFAEHHCLPALMANALYEDKYPLSTAIGRPLIAKKLVETAHRYGATAVAHGCTGKGNDQVRMDIGVRALDPTLEIIAPARAADWPSREELIDYVTERGIPVNLTKKSPYSIDENMWGRSNECGVLEDPWVAPPEDAFQFVKSVSEAPDEPQTVVVSFEKGKPVALDGVQMGMVELIEKIDAIGNAHGFGRVDMIENRLVGIKSREVYEVAGLAGAHHRAPGARGPRAHARPAALQEDHREQARRHDLRGPVVRPAHRGLQGVPLPEPGAGHRRGAAQVPQGQLRGRGSPERLLAVQLQAGHVHGPRTSSRTRRLPASSSSGACRSRCGRGSARNTT